MSTTNKLSDLTAPMLTSETPFSFVYVTHARGIDVIRKEVPFSAWAQNVANKRSIREKKDGLLFSPTIYREGQNRAKTFPDAVEFVTALVLDMDSGVHPHELEDTWRTPDGEPLAHVVYSSYSSTKDKPKWRVIFPLVAPIPGSEWKTYWLRADYYLAQGKSDQQCKDAKRMHYMPSCPEATQGEAFGFFEPGALLDLSLFADPPATYKPKPERKQNIVEGDLSGRPTVETLLSIAIEKAEEGEGRNNSCLWLACQMRDNRYTIEEAHEAATIYADTITHVDGHTAGDAFPTHEAARVVENAFDREPREPWQKTEFTKTEKREYAKNQDAIEESQAIAQALDNPDISDDEVDRRKLDEVGFRARFVLEHGENVRYDHSRNKWLLWNGRRWKEDKDKKVQEFALKTLRNIHKEAGGDFEEAAKLAKFAREMSKAQKVSAMLSLACSHPQIATTNERYDSDKFLLNVQNGTIDLRTGELKPHDKNDLLTRISAVKYDPNAKSDLWEACLVRWQPDAEVREFLARAAGYSLTGDTSEQTCFFLHGDGSNGKSIFTQSLEYILGDYAQRVRISTLLESKKDNSGTTPDLVNLPGARLVIFSELNEDARLNEGLVKDLTGGERITVNPKFAGVFSFTPQFKPWLYGNHKPRLKGSDLGIRRRLPLIPFTETIPEAEKDTNLDKKLKSEGAGILTWAVRGCLEWQQQGRLNPPDSIIEATTAYHTAQDTFGKFLADRCQFHKLADVKKSDFIKAYKAYMDDLGEYALTPFSINEKLEQRGVREKPTRRDGAQIRVLFGLTLLPEDGETPDLPPDFEASENDVSRGKATELQTVHENQQSSKSDFSRRDFTEKPVPPVALVAFAKKQGENLPDFDDLEEGEEVYEV
jgi:P4 family phage/plasmid primase-like protien